MIKYYRTMDHQIHEISEPMEGTWISLIHPTAAELAKRPENKGKNIVALLPDSGDRYYSTALFTE